MEAKNRPIEKENHLPIPNHSFQVPAVHLPRCVLRKVSIIPSQPSFYAP